MHPPIPEPQRDAIRRYLAAYATPSPVRATVELLGVAAFVPLALAVLRWGLWAGPLGWVIAAPTAVLLGLTYIKLFLIQHDGSHGSYYRGARANQGAALLAGIVSNTTPSVWKAEHDRHHLYSNNLDHDQDGQTAALTVRDFDALSTPLRWAYAITSHQAVLFTVVPLAYFFVFMKVKARPHEVLVQVLWFGLLYALGLLHWYVLSFWAVGCFGFLIFHAQHTFDGVYKRRTPTYDAFENGVYGSSLLVLPHLGPLNPLLRFAFHGVGNHHIHHLGIGIPGYRLDACQAASADLFEHTPRVTLLDALRTVSYSLYDEASGSFQSASRRLLKPTDT